MNHWNMSLARNALPPIRVGIVEDDKAVREGLAQLIGGTPGYECAAAFRSVEEALASRAAPPDVMLLDIHLPGMPGTQGVRALRERHPGLQILMLTVDADEDKIFEAIRNGACGYLLKKTPPSQLLEALRQVQDGGAPMSPEIARKVIEIFQKTRSPQKAEYHLAPQEVRLLALLAQGYSYQGVANQLHVSINTVRNYIRSIYDKLHVHSRSEAVSKALRGGII